MPVEEGTNDLGRFLTGFTTSRGRTSEFTPVEAGEGSLVLNNQAGPGPGPRPGGVFDPTNTNSLLYADLVPFRPVTITWPHPFTGIGYDVFAGYVEDWQYRHILATGSQTTVPIVDAFELMSQGHDRALFYAAAHVNARIHAALNDMGWPFGKRHITTGNVNVQGITYPDATSTLEIINDAATAEFPGVSMFFIDKSGNATFTGRGVRFGLDGDEPWVAYPQFVKLWRVGDAAACFVDPSLIPMVEMEFSKGKEALYNDVACAPRNASDDLVATNRVPTATNDLQAASDSIEKYGRRSFSTPDLLILDGTGASGPVRTAADECLNIAYYYAKNYSTPHPRIQSVSFHGQMDDGYTKPGSATPAGSALSGPGVSGSLWNFILNVEINHVLEVHTYHAPGVTWDRNAVQTYPLNIGDLRTAGGFAPDIATRTGYFFVEKISNEVTALNDVMPKWTMTLELSPMARYTDPLGGNSIYHGGGETGSGGGTPGAPTISISGSPIIGETLTAVIS